MNAKARSSLAQQRAHVVEQMLALDQMRRGSLSRQFLRTGPRAEVPAAGPYYVLQGYLRGRKFSRRIPAQEAPAVAAQVANYRRFQALADEFVSLTEALTLGGAAGAKKTAGGSRPRAVPGNHRLPPASAGAMEPAGGA
jgi:hypothetical protein